MAKAILKCQTELKKGRKRNTAAATNKRLWQRQMDFSMKQVLKNEIPLLMVVSWCHCGRGFSIEAKMYLSSYLLVYRAFIGKRLIGHFCNHLFFFKFGLTLQSTRSHSFWLKMSSNEVLVDLESPSTRPRGQSLRLSPLFNIIIHI